MKEDLVRQLMDRAGTDVSGKWMSRDHALVFAQLIVRECVGVGLERKKWVEDQTAHNARDLVWNQARIQQSEHIVDKIKEHFGVEL
jgi:hypothetical protein